MDAMDHIIQIIEREFGVTQPVDQPQDPSQTAKGTTKTDSPANGSDPAAIQPTISWSSSYSEAASKSESEISTQPLTLPSSSTTTPLTSTSSSSTTSSSSFSSLTTTTTQNAATEAPTDTTDTGASNSLSSTSTKLAIALPIAIVGLLIIATLAFFFLRRRSRRNAPPQYDIATGQTRAISTAELMALQKIEGSGPAMSSMHHLPVIQVAQYQEHAASPGSATARAGINDSHTDLGLTVSVPLNQRHSASENDLPRFSGSASRTSTPRMPFESRGGGTNDNDDDDDVSVVSDMNERRNRERDFDDMSSVSSFEDDEIEHVNGHNNGHSR